MINSSLIWQDLSTNWITNYICSVLEQSLTSSTKLEKTLDSLSSEIMPVTFSSPRKQVNSFCVVLDMYFALKLHHLPRLENFQRGVSRKVYPPPHCLKFFWNSLVDRRVSSKKSSFSSSMKIGAIPKKNPKQVGGLRTWNFLGVYWKNIIWQFQRSIKKEPVFPGVIKKGLVFFSPGSSMGCKTIFAGMRGEASVYLEFLMKWQT